MFIFVVQADNFKIIFSSVIRGKRRFEELNQGFDYILRLVKIVLV